MNKTQENTSRTGNLKTSVGIVFANYKGAEGQKKLAKACLERGFTTSIFFLKGNEIDLGSEMRTLFPAGRILSLGAEEFYKQDQIDIFIASDHIFLEFPHTSKVVLFHHSVYLEPRSPENIADSLIHWGAICDYYFTSYPESAGVSEAMLGELAHPEEIFSRGVQNDDSFHLIPGGYMNFDARLNVFQDEPIEPDAIVYAPTVLSYDVAKSDSRAILLTLLEKYPDYAIIYVVNAEDLQNPFTHTLIEEASRFPNFVDQGRQPNMSALVRAATVITDSSTVGTTFPLYSLRPSIHCRLAGDRHEEGPFGYEVQGMHNLLNAVNATLAQPTLWEKRLKEQRNNLLLRPGYSYEYLADNLSHIKNGTSPDEWKRVRRSRLSHADLTIEDLVTRWKSAPYYLRERYIDCALQRWGLTPQTALMQLVLARTSSFCCRMDDGGGISFHDLAQATAIIKADDTPYFVWATMANYEAYYRNTILRHDNGAMLGFISSETCPMQAADGYGVHTIKKALAKAPQAIIYGTDPPIQQTIMYDICSAYGMDSDPSLNPMYHYALGCQLRDKQDFVGAESAFKTALKLHPNTPVAYYDLAHILDRQRRHSDAAQAMAQALKFDTCNASMYRDYGCFLMRDGQLDEAVAAHRHAIELSPGLSSPYIQLSLALEQQGDIATAIKRAEQAITLEEDAKYYHHLGNLLFKSGALEQAAQAQQQAAQQNPALFGPHVQLYEIFIKQGNPAKANRELDNAITKVRSALAADDTSVGLQQKLTDLLHLKGNQGH